jgi:hypothetical protein
MNQLPQRDLADRTRLQKPGARLPRHAKAASDEIDHFPLPIIANPKQFE